MLAELTWEETSAVLDEVVLDLLDQAGLPAPPVSAFEVARRVGILVAVDDDQRGRARSVRLSGRGRDARPAILMRSDPRAERRQFAVAHEIGEHVAHRVFDRLGVDPREAPPTTREQVANHLAGRILTPTDWLLAEGRSADWDLFALKRRFETASHELIARRMLECPPSVVLSIFDNGRLYFRHSNVPGQVPPPSELEASCRRQANETGHPSHAEGVAAWPIHEPGWQREIVRREVDELAEDVIDEIPHWGYS